MKNGTGTVVLAGIWIMLSITACRPPVDIEVPNAEYTMPFWADRDESAKRYDIAVLQTDNGVIKCSRTYAAAGAAVMVILSPRDEYYRYRAGSLTVEPDVELRDSGGGIWKFTMPEENVSITAEFEEIPFHTITISDRNENGNFTVTGVDMTGPHTGHAMEGSPVTVWVTPDAGYKMADNGLRVIPADMVTFAKVNDQFAWTFNMADIDLEIGVEFTELETLEIYKGGARKGITVGELSDDKKFYTGSVDTESEELGHNGNRRALKITHALNTNGNAVQQSFGLFSDTEIDLDNVTALSFWARADKPLNIRYVGFGDDDPDKRIVYTGENYNQQIPVGVEWTRYVVPVPTARSGQRASRVFFFNASIAIDNFVCIDDIELVKSGVALTDIFLTGENNGLFYSAADAAKILRGTPIKLTYACDDGTIVTLQNAGNSHTLKYNLFPWLIPYVEAGGNGALSVNIPGVRNNTITACVIDGLSLDDFEDITGTGNITIPVTPAGGTGYLWHTAGSGSVVVSRDYFTVAHQEIHNGLRAGSWRPAATANNPRGGRNFVAKNAAAYQTLSLWIKVTAGDGNTILQKNMVFTFELRNGGTLIDKNSGSFYARQFTYDTGNADGWQEVIIPLADFIELGLDITAITGYALGVVDHQGTALRIILDDIALKTD